MTETIAGITVPDTELARAATDLVREASDDNLYHHCRRVFFFGMLKAAHRGQEVDPELAYVGGMFHDLGLTKAYRTTDRRFEVDGAQTAYEFLREHGRSEQEARDVWLAIALHTTPGVPEHLAPEVGVVSLGVETDVLGFDLDEITAEQREEIVAAHPRPGFKERIVRAFYEGIQQRPDTAFGTMNEDVLVHLQPNHRRKDFVEIIRANDWAE